MGLFNMFYFCFLELLVNKTIKAFPSQGAYHRGYRDRENEEEEDDYPPLASLKTPIILAKPATEKVSYINIK